MTLHCLPLTFPGLPSPSQVAEAGSKPPVALFRVAAQLSAPEVHVSPPLPEINKALGKFVKSLVESTRAFVRWLHGSCIETPPQHVSDDEDPVVFSFFSDIIANPDIVSCVAQVTRTVEKTFGRVNKQLDAYRKYDQLWKMDKQQHLGKFEAKQPTCVMFDSRLLSYSRVVVDAQEMEPEIAVDFMRIQVSSLLGDIQEHAKAWITAIATLMKNMGCTQLKELHDLIASHSLELDKEPDTLDDLKYVLGLIADINRRSMETELQYVGLEEWYRTLDAYGFAVPEDEAKMVGEVRPDWESDCFWLLLIASDCF